MISYHINKKNYCQAKNLSDSSVLCLNLHQKTIKSFCENKNLAYKKSLSKDIEKSKACQIIPHVNDENCSFNSNTIQVKNFKDEKLIKKQDPILLKLQNKSQETQQDVSSKKVNELNKVINLKKKIKKCSSNLMSRSQSYFREKVSFIRKMYRNKSNENDQNLNCEKQVRNAQKQQMIQTYPVYRDSEVFPGQRGEQLRRRIVAQRMDNDTETDDEQIEKFVNRIKTEFMTHFQKMTKQKKNLVKEKSIQKMKESRIDQ